VLLPLDAVPPVLAVPLPVVLLGAAVLVPAVVPDAPDPLVLDAEPPLPVEPLADPPDIADMSLRPVTCTLWPTCCDRFSPPRSVHDIAPMSAPELDVEPLVPVAELLDPPVVPTAAVVPALAVVLGELEPVLADADALLSTAAFISM